VEGKMIKYWGTLLVIISACSVNRGSDGNLDYDQERNIYFKKIGQYAFSLKSYSSDKLAAVNYSEDSISKDAKDSIIRDYDNFICFVFEIDIDGFRESIIDYDEPGKEFNYDEKVNYYLFNMQRNLKLKNGKGIETPCTIYYHERMNEISRTNRFIVGFKKIGTEDAIFEYTNPYLNCGKVNISINKKDLALK
jgi:hypothetical protein